MSFIIFFGKHCCTSLHLGFWTNLIVFAKHLEIILYVFSCLSLSMAEDCQLIREQTEFAVPPSYHAATVWDHISLSC